METDSWASRTQPVPARVRPSTTDAVVTALRELVDEWTGTPPITAAVTGWDMAGRPDIAGLLRRRFPELTHVICSFDAAEWEGESRSPGAMLAAGVARAAGQHRRWWRRAFQPVSTELSSPQTRWWRRLTAAVISVVVAAVVVALPGVRDSLASLAGKGGVIGDLAAQATHSPTATAAVIAALFSLPAGAPDADRRGHRHVRALIPNIVALPRPSSDDVRSRET